MLHGMQHDCRLAASQKMGEKNKINFFDKN